MLGLLIMVLEQIYPDRSNLFNVLTLNYKEYYLTKKNTINKLLVTKNNNNKIQAIISQLNITSVGNILGISSKH